MSVLTVENAPFLAALSDEHRVRAVSRAAKLARLRVIAACLVGLLFLAILFVALLAYIYTLMLPGLLWPPLAMTGVMWLIVFALHFPLVIWMIGNVQSSAVAGKLLGFIAESRCVVCAYDLRGLGDAGSCPECGAADLSNQPRTSVFPFDPRTKARALRSTPALAALDEWELYRALCRATARSWRRLMALCLLAVPMSYILVVPFSLVMYFGGRGLGRDPTVSGDFLLLVMVSVFVTGVVLVPLGYTKFCARMYRRRAAGILRRAVARGECVVCGFDVGGAHSRCPECGTRCVGSVEGNGGGA